MPPQSTIYNPQPRRSGFAALIAIVAIGAAALLLAYNASILGLGELELGYSSQQGSEAFSLAEGCMDEALRRLRLNPLFPTGDINPPVLGGGSCRATITQGSPIVVVAIGCTTGVIPCVTQGAYSKTVRAELTITTSPPGINAINISRWEEIP